MRGIVSRVRSMALGPGARSAIAKSVSRSGAYYPFQRVLGRLAGGFILAFHNPSVERFVEHIESLGPNRPVALSELVERQARGGSTAGLFAITFDDGVGDTVRAIAAVIAERQWPATFFLPTGYLEQPLSMPFQWLRAIEPYLPARSITLPSGPLDLSTRGALRVFSKEMARLMYTGRSDRYAPLVMELVDFVLAHGLAERRTIEPPAPITWEEVSRLSRSPVIRFESHGVSHCALSALEPDEIESELRESRDTIQAHTNLPCEHFCYPFGGRESIGSSAPQIAARYYRSAVTMVRGRLGRHNPYLLPRIPLYPDDDAAVARLKVLTL